MPHSHSEQISAICPPLHWRPLVWLTSSAVAPAEVSEELRASLFNRMASMFASVVVLLLATTSVAIRHPQAPFIIWAVMDAVMSLVRSLSAFAILRHRARHPGEAAPDSLAPDIFIVSGLLWCATLGCGTGLCLASGDLGTSVVGALLASATTGAQPGRIPGAPRLLTLQVGLICLPLCVGGCFAPDAFLQWGILAVPAYLVASITISGQLHRDYVEMIVGRYESRLMALRCPMTGLANRRAFDRALATALATPARARATVVLSLDLDGFKSVNDALGHLAGDMLLRQVAERLTRHVPAAGLTARLGGDEFAILTQGAASGGAEQLARTVLAALREPFPISGHNVNIGASIGLARATAFSTPDRLLGEADAALYASKRSGKNRYGWFSGDAAMAGVPGSGEQPQADTGRPVQDVREAPLIRSPASVGG